MSDRPDLPNLPVNAALPALLTALGDGANAVLVAPPGAGKTTLVPLALLDQPWRRDGTILLLEPRRLAARAAARRMAQLLGEETGATIGYAMRMETRISKATRILVVTESVLSRMILDDPTLDGISAVLFDEFHERSLDGDFGLALALDVQAALRPDLRLIAMSATINGARVAKLLGDAPVIESQGRSFPVEIRYQERGAGEPVEDAVARVVRNALADESGSILAFLPGQREIERTAERLAGQLPENAELAPLYGALEAKAQDAAIRPTAIGRRKIVLATAIAETSITIDGVRVVIDSGLARLPKFEPSTGLTRLETERVSRASADQRAGRAGRTEPGVAIRLWRAEQTAALPAYTPPEILQADLSGMVLDCAAFGVTEPASLRFLDPPPVAALSEARILLRALHAIDHESRITEAGKAMRRLALPVRLAHMVAEAARRGEADRAALLAVLITERGLGGEGPDIERRLERFVRERGPRAENARQLARRIARQAAHGSPADADGNATGHSVGRLLVDAWPDRVAKARGERGRFILANGRGAALAASDPMAGEPFLIIADLQGKAQNARIASAATVSEAEIQAALGDHITRHSETSFENGRVRVRETERLGAIVLAERMLSAPAGEAANDAVIAAVRQHRLAILPWGKASETLRRRLQWLHRSFGEPWPDMSDEALTAALDDWLRPYLNGDADLVRMSDETLREALLSVVPPDLQRRIDRLAPTHFNAPSGSHAPIRYDEEAPVLAIRVQELFGLATHPSIADGRVPMVLELLSPAHRPIQTTRDLPGFWKGSWADVRADMRGRYPKHVWPEDPLTTAATSRAKPRIR